MIIIINRYCDSVYESTPKSAFDGRAVAKAIAEQALGTILAKQNLAICPDSAEGKPNYTWLYSKVFLTKLFGAKIKSGAELAFRRGLVYGSKNWLWLLDFLELLDMLSLQI